MPYIEIPHDLAEWLADQIGVYGAHDEDERKMCRICWTSLIVDRIRAAVHNEQQE